LIRSVSVSKTLAIYISLNLTQIHTSYFSVNYLKTEDRPNTVEPGYNDIALCDTSYITSDILRYQLIPRCYWIKGSHLMICRKVTAFYWDEQRNSTPCEEQGDRVYW